MVRENHKPFRSGNVLVHGLICCKNGCGYWNRDVNGATNIYKIAYIAINKKERNKDQFIYQEARILQLL
mgnify:CR=1 FL=1